MVERVYIQEGADCGCEEPHQHHMQDQEGEDHPQGRVEYVVTSHLLLSIIDLIFLVLIYWDS